MSEHARWRRNPRVVLREIKPGTFGLWNPERAGALFVDALGVALLEAVDALGAPAAARQLVAQTPGLPRERLEALAAERRAALARAGARAAAPTPAAGDLLLGGPPCSGPTSGEPGPAKGLCYLAAVLEAEGVARARILDLRSPAARPRDTRAAQAAWFAARVESLRPRVLGLTSVSATIADALFLARLAKLLFPQTCVVLGGHHASYEWQALLRDEPAVDAVVRGEGELSFPPLVRAVLEQDPGRFCFDGLAGVAWRDAQGRPRDNGWSQPVEDLDRLPTPRDRDYVLDAADYEWTNARVLTGRGCTFQCSFCSTATFAGRRIRQRSLERVLDELRGAVERDGVRSFTFDDDIFTVNRARTLSLCRALSASGLGERAVWGCNTRLDCIDEELMDALAGAGCRSILFGVESGDAAIQARFGKGPRSLHRLREKLEHLAALGVEANLNFILGLPGETPATLQALLELVQGLPRRVSYAFSFLNVFPGTPLERDMQRLGLRFLSDDPLERFHLTAPSVTTPDLDAEAQIDAYLRLRYFCETGQNTFARARLARSA